MKIGIFIPCYNVETRIVAVLERLECKIENLVDTVLIFDNCSSDGTVAQVAAFLSKKNGQKFHLYRNSQNYSLGGSTILAFAEANRRHLDYLFCLHGDGQADPGDMVPLIESLAIEPYDFIFGSRFLPDSDVEAYSRLRKWGNSVFIFIQRWLVGIGARDLGAMLGFRMSTIRELPFSRLRPSMSYHPYLVLSAFLLSRRKLTWTELPISWGPVEHSNINIWTYGLRYFIRLLRLRFIGVELVEDQLATMRTAKVSCGTTACVPNSEIATL